MKATDKQVALSKRERLVREAQRERYGIIPPRSLSAALTTPLAIHLKEFIASFRCSDEMNDTSSSGSQRFPVCSQNAAGNRRDQPGPVPEMAAGAYGRCEDIERIPFRCEHIHQLGKAQQAPLPRKPPPTRRENFNRRPQTYERRPFTDAELRRLIAVSAYRSVVYLTAAHTGLRRKELGTLVWADLFLDLPNPHIVARRGREKRVLPARSTGWIQSEGKAHLSQSTVARLLRPWRRVNFSDTAGVLSQALTATAKV